MPADAVDWGSDTLVSVERVEGSEGVMDMVSSRLLFALSRSIDGEALVDSLLAGDGATVFFCSSGFEGSATFFSMAPAKDFSSCGFEGIDDPIGGGGGSAAVPYRWA